MKVNVRAVLEDCINKGIDAGFRRAHKHVENPTEGFLKEKIAEEIWLNLDTYFNFEGDGEPFWH